MAEKGTQLARALHEVANYPPHPPRRATALYTKTHKRLIVELQRPCLVKSCGVTQAILDDPVKSKDPTHNPWGATQLETHHHLVEDSLANAVDVDKFNKYLLPRLKQEHAKHCADGSSTHPEKYDKPFTREQMLDWVHGDELNMWVLCDIHHRHPYVGIHAITFPIWSVQDLLVDGYDLTGFKPASPVEAGQLQALPQTIGKPDAVGAIPPPEPGSTSGAATLGTA